ncbi:hypothetical protein IHE45_08G048600 [Dioscorea alata]|uniref:Uncharacterized protein n=1 Tax=Dioscorea alata TaxID=55571 RepID=A0ACB7VJ21_DIOAL|nr:hypothetical protein IHE45_08G048600 [Dioscorea alata]
MANSWTLFLFTILILSMPFHTLASTTSWQGSKNMVFHNKIFKVEEVEKKGSLMGRRSFIPTTSARLVPTGPDPIHHNQAPNSLSP